MGRIIQQSNGKTTVYVTGENFSSLSATSNTYFVGVDLSSGSFEKKNPNGSIINLESGTGGTTFTGGTVTGATNFSNGLTANTLSSSSVACSGGISAGSISSSSVACSGGVSAGSLSATTYLNLPADIYITGGTYSAGTLTLSRTVLSNITVTGFTTGGGVITTTYSQLVSDILSSGLTTGSFYLISDYQTCYDQPDFDYDNNPITTGNYKQASIEPLMVLATSVNTISTDAYQPAYPNDKIRYDWSFSATEVTNSAAFGRITERVDEFNNRTDYDHRNILFKRYRLYTYRRDQPLNGSIEIIGTGPNNVSGTTTQFTNLSVGDVIYVLGVSPSYYEIVNISGDTLMSITGDTLSSFGSGFEFYKCIEETNDSNGYFSIKRTNVKTNDYIEYTTFGDAINQNYAINNFVGNYANYYQNIGSGTFILANNVFLEGGYQTNKFGDYCYNNTFGTDNSNNIWGDWCYENVSTNDIDDNIIGHSFNNNLINTNLSENHIGNDFSNNQLLAENSEDFEDNIIGNGFNNNIIYSRFYKNEILDNFNDNVIGDSGNLNNFEFYRNYIRNNFNNNTIRQDFQNNQTGTNFQGNTTNGEFIGNTILNGFNNNRTGNYFSVNNIGNGFNNNTIHENFYYNTTGYYFNDNVISNDFNSNNIGTYFTNNRPSNETLFGWNDLSTVSTRTYSTFVDVVGGGQLGRRLLGKELVMFVASTSQYFRIMFTQWTQDGNGGGFQYERQELDSNGNSIGSSVLFTKTNNGSEIDVIIPGVLEITRGNNGGIYNVVSEGSWSGSISPSGTTWNSIYTQSDNGERFGYNKIGNNFNNNTISSDFGYGGGQPYGNVILDDFRNNIIGQFAYNNVIGNRFENNTVGLYFENNTIKNYFNGNAIGNNFENNEIGDYFGNNGGLVQNTIFNNFRNNKIGNYFGNDINYPTVTGGTGNDGGNIINDNFQFNEVGNNFIYNATDLDFQYNKIGTDAWFNVFGTNTEHNIIGDLFVGNGGSAGFPSPMGNFLISNKFGNYSAFNFIGNNFQYNTIGDFFGNAGVGTENNIPDNFNNNNIGNYFGDDGSHTSGGNNIINDFYDNLIGNKFYSNTIEQSFYRNDIGNDYYYNSILDVPVGAYFQNNEIGNRFNNNTINGYFYGNTIAGGFNNNDITDNFYSNEIGFGFNRNTLSDGFGNNVVQYYFNNNVLGQNCYFNHFKDYFNNNNFGNNLQYNNFEPNFSTNTGVDDFRYNNISDSLNNVDFSLSTLVYDTSMNKNIFKIQGGTYKLSYYDSSAVLQIANITD